MSFNSCLLLVNANLTIFLDNRGVMRKKNASASGLCAKNLLPLHKKMPSSATPAFSWYSVMYYIPYNESATFHAMNPLHFMQ